MNDAVPRLTAALVGRYTIERELGAGGMATVYLAHDVRHERKVALKVLRPELAAVIGAERFLHEIKTTANLQHPHILPLHDSGTVDGTVFYVMPYVEGESLRDRLQREKQLPIDHALRIAKEVASALDYAHRHGIIHRDIKPENILLHDGQALVADFGIALAASSAGGARMTETGMSLGTPSYMSPEQAMGERTLDARTDVYALGCVLYEMLTGEPPFTGPTAQAIVARVLTSKPEAVSVRRHTVPAQVDAAVRVALEKLPADRFATASEFAAALDNTSFRLPATSTAAPLPAARTGLRSVTGHRSVPWGLVAILLVLVFWLARNAGRADSATGPTRFAVDLEQVQSFPSSHNVLVTPDGRTVIVSAIVAGRAELVMRRLDQFETTVIPGGAGASRPFLSADGRWLAFAVNGKLVKLPIEGGTPIALADARWGGGNWSEDGTIIYTATYQSGLWQVSALGGQARMLTAPDTSSGELAHWWPQLLPGGRHVLFTAYRTPIARATIEVLDLRTGARDTLVEGGVMARYAPSGHLLFARDESLLAVPFDLGRRAVTGAAVVVVDDVAMNPSDGFAAYDISPTGTLAYMPSSAAGSRFLLVEADRRGTERIILDSPDRYANPRFAPDQQRISLDIEAARSAADVWVLDRVRGSRLRITSEPAADFGAVWTPDGRDLIYMSERPLFELYRRAADASRPPEPLLTGTHDRINGSVSADGRLLAFTLSVPASAELWTVPLQGKADAQRYLANGFQLGHSAISPDGHWMVYDSDESGRIEVYLQSFPNPTNSRRQISSGGGSEPIWTRAGRELVFRRGDTIMAVTVEPSGEAGTPAALFAGPYQDATDWNTPRSYDASPDGQRFLLLKWPPGDARRRVLVTTNWFPELVTTVGWQRE